MIIDLIAQNMAPIMFTALVVTRLVFDWLLAKGWLTHLRMLHIIRGAKIDFMRWAVQFGQSGNHFLGARLAFVTHLLAGEYREMRIAPSARRASRRPSSTSAAPLLPRGSSRAARTAAGSRRCRWCGWTGCPVRRCR